MTDRRRDQHDNGPDPALLGQLTTDEVLVMRAEAVDNEDLAGALRADNELDTRGELADFSDGRRRTCGACEGWADHIHDPLTDEPMKVPRWHPLFTRADVDTATQIAWQVFALAAALGWAWDELADGSHWVTVGVRASDYRVIVPADDADGRPGTAYLDSYASGAAGPQPPVIYANARAATDARRYLTPPA